MIFDAVDSDEFFVWFDFVPRCLWWVTGTIRLVSADLIAGSVNERDWGDIITSFIIIIGLNSSNFLGWIKVDSLSVIELNSISFEKRRLCLVRVTQFYPGDSGIILVPGGELYGCECEAWGHLCEDGFGGVLKVDLVAFRLSKVGQLTQKIFRTDSCTDHGLSGLGLLQLVLPLKFSDGCVSLLDDRLSVSSGFLKLCNLSFKFSL